MLLEWFSHHFISSIQFHRPFVHLSKKIAPAGRLAEDLILMPPKTSAEVPSTSPNNPGVLREVLDPSPSCPWSFSPQVKRFPKLVTLAFAGGRRYQNLGRNPVKVRNWPIAKRVSYIMYIQPHVSNKERLCSKETSSSNHLPTIHFQGICWFSGEQGFQTGILSGKASHFWPNIPNLPILCDTLAYDGSLTRIGLDELLLFQ